jgi:glycosyltransferase involved in cell wall biosynthesis
MSLPRFSIIIPVKNRVEYIGNTLKTCSAQDYRNLDIIVADDCSTDGTGEAVKDAMRCDPRIRYFGHKEPIGMKANFEFAINQVDPGYIMALGGDDGLLPNSVRTMSHILATTKLQLLTWPAALYSFPGVYDPNGQLIVYHRRGLKIINSSEFLNRQSKELWYLNDVECPMFYVKGVVSTDLVQAVKSRSPDGAFYSCATPDGFSGIVLAGEVKEYVFSGEPLSIFGMSSASQGLAYLSNDSKSKAESDIFFQDSLNKPMHHALAGQPYSPLITLMTADYLLTCHDLPGWGGKFNPINFKCLIDKSLNELAQGMYGSDRIMRELKIVRNIARLHGEEKYFIGKLSKMRRFIRRSYFCGSGISLNAFFFSGRSLGINNIVDASGAAYTIHKMYEAANPRSILSALFKSGIYRLRTRVKGSKFPTVVD